MFFDNSNVWQLKLKVQGTIARAASELLLIYSGATLQLFWMYWSGQHQIGAAFDLHPEWHNGNDNDDSSLSKGYFLCAVWSFLEILRASSIPIE